MLHKPRPLAPGDRIAVVAPSSPFESANLDRGLEWLRAQGYDAVVAQSAHQRHRYLAGTDAARATDLQRALVDPTIAAVICARGGYGSARLLSHLEASAIRPHCKLVCGFSDVTTLHLWLNQACGWVTFHGPMIATRFAGEGFDSDTATSLLAALRGETAAVHAPDARTAVPGRAHGRLVGGNLTLLCHSIGTAHEVDTDGALLLIEDVHESPYRIDRMLTHLRQAGKLVGVRGVIVGEMEDCAAPDDAGYTLDEVIADCLSGLSVPTVTHFPISHGAPNHTVALGIEYELDADAKRLLPLEPSHRSDG